MTGFPLPGADPAEKKVPEQHALIYPACLNRLTVYSHPKPL